MFRNSAIWAVNPQPTAFGFAAFRGYWAYQWIEMGEYGPGKPTVVGVAILAAIAGISGLVGLIRMVTGTAKSVKLPERAQPSRTGLFTRISMLTPLSNATSRSDRQEARLNRRAEPTRRLRRSNPNARSSARCRFRHGYP